MASSGLLRLKPPQFRNYISISFIFERNTTNSDNNGRSFFECWKKRKGPCSFSEYCALLDNVEAN